MDTEPISNPMRPILYVMASVLNDLLCIAAGLGEKRFTLAERVLPIDIPDRPSYADAAFTVFAGIDLYAAVALVSVNMVGAFTVRALRDGGSAADQRCGQCYQDQATFHDILLCFTPHPVL